MALKDEWKKTGKGLGSAMASFGKAIGKSAKAIVNGEDENESNVFNDGTWRQTGKELGSAFKGLGNSIVDTAKEGIEEIEKDDNENK